jgi:hypothetical protein
MQQMRFILSAEINKCEQLWLVHRLTGIGGCHFGVLFIRFRVKPIALAKRSTPLLQCPLHDSRGTDLLQSGGQFHIIRLQQLVSEG